MRRYSKLYEKLSEIDKETIRKHLKGNLQGITQNSDDAEFSVLEYKNAILDIMNNEARLWYYETGTLSQQAAASYYKKVLRDSRRNNIETMRGLQKFRTSRNK